MQLVLIFLFLCMSALAHAALPTTSTPEFILVKTIRTTPFTGTQTSMQDHEGLAQQGGDLWILDDKSGVYRVNPEGAGTLELTRGLSSFSNAVRYDGTAPATGARSGDLEGLAWDPGAQRLIAFAGICCAPDNNLPAAFRFTASGGSFQWQPLPSGSDFGAAAKRPGGSLYVSDGATFRSYNFTTNVLGQPITVSGVSNVQGMEFTANGNDLLVVTNQQRLIRINTTNWRVVAGWDIELGQFGVGDSRAVTLINGAAPAYDRIFISEGLDGETGPDRFAVHELRVQP